jgi:hypothetical protein
MSYVGLPFNHDIFISYSHGNGSGRGKLKLWSQGFARELEGELRAYPKMGRELCLFLDEHRRPSQGVDPMEPLTEQLREDIERSALLTVIMTPHYLESRWCGDERNWWIERQLEHALVTPGRVAVVHAWPTPTPWPEALSDSRGKPLLGFPFHNEAEAEEHPQPFEWPEPKANSQGEFREALLRLTGWLKLKLEAVKEELEERRRREAEIAKLGATTGQAVYLYGRAEYRETWEVAYDQLIASGFGVFPGEPDAVERDPQKAQDTQRKRVEALGGCDALLLVGTQDGRALDADLAVVGRTDRQLARDRYNRLLPCAVLDVGGIGLPRRKLNARNLDIDWIDARQDQWIPSLQRWLVEKSQFAKAVG